VRAKKSAVELTEKYLNTEYILLNMKLKCQRCGYEWNYKGKSKWYTSCPKCKTSVKIKELRISDVEIGYIAGIIDGEGTFIMGKHNKTIQLVIRVANTDFRLIKWLQNKLGGSLILDKRNDNIRAPIMVWQFHVSNGMLNFLEKIKPYLIIKRKQAELFIQYLKSHKQGTLPTKEELKIVEEFRKINKKPSYKFYNKTKNT